MIYGIGVDIVTVSRMEKWLRRSDGRKIVARFFHEQEIADAFSVTKTTALSLSARFAAKEAFGKALGTGLRGLRLKDICVKSAYNGKPSLQVYGTAQKAAKTAGISKIFVSLSHEKELAIAVVVLETDGSRQADELRR